MITTTTTLPPQVQQSVDDVLLAVETPGLIYKLGAETKRLRAKGGTTLRMSRYRRLPTAPVPLGPSGATPPALNPQRVDIDATVSFYGAYIAVNQQVKEYTACFKSVLIDLETVVAVMLTGNKAQVFI